MGLITTSRVWTRQPQFRTGIAKNGSPLAMGLVEAFIPSTPDLIASASTAVIRPTAAGMAFFGNGSSSYWFRNTAPAALNNSSQWTIAAFVVGATTADTRILDYGNSTDDNTLLCIGSGTVTASKVSVWSRNTSGTTPTGAGDTTKVAFEAGVPHVIVFTEDNVTLRSYIDGVADLACPLVWGSATPINRVAANAFYRSSGAGGFSASGLLLGAAWNRALTPGEVADFSENPWQIFRPTPTLFTGFSLAPASNTVSPTSGAVVAAGTTPTISQGQALYPTSAAAIAAGATPTLSQGQALYPTSGAIDAAGTTPTVAQGGSVSPTSGVATFAGATPTLSQGQSLSPTIGAVVAAGTTPTISQGQALYPASTSAIAAGTTPTIAQGQSLSPTSGAFLAAGGDPIVVQGGALSPSSCAVVAAGTTPTISQGQAIYPANGSTVWSGETPTVNQTAVSGTGATVEQIWAYEIEPGVTAAVAMRRALAMLCGKVTGAGTDTEVFRDINDTRDAVVVHVDSNGNRTSVAFDDGP